MRFWHVARWVGLVLVVLVLSVGLARLFSGEEHDQAAGSRSGGQYLVQVVVPWVILVAGVASLLIGAVVSARISASREALRQNVRFFGTVSLAALLLGLVVALGLGAALASGICCGKAELNNETLFALLAAMGMAGFLGLVGVQTHVAKKMMEAHYDLKRNTALLQDTVERLVSAGREAGVR
jgi:cytochrome bd-type quinol oxidase subunit 2